VRVLIEETPGQQQHRAIQYYTRDYYKVCVCVCFYYSIREIGAIRQLFYGVGTYTARGHWKNLKNLGSAVAADIDRQGWSLTLEIPDTWWVSPRVTVIII